MEGALAKLKIEAYTDRRFQDEAPVPSVVVPINPSKYTRNSPTATLPFWPKTRRLIAPTRARISRT